MGDVLMSESLYWMKLITVQQFECKFLEKCTTQVTFLLIKRKICDQNKDRTDK